VTRAAPPLGVVLAGGRGRRFGHASKPCVALLGRPLIDYPLRAVIAALGAAVVVCKQDTQLPALADGVEVWYEPDRPAHPLVGLVEALRRAGGRAVFVCGADMPCLTAAEVRAVAGVDPGPAPAVVPCAAGRLQPLCAVYEPAALARLERALAAVGERAAASKRAAPLTATVAALAPRVIERGDAAPYFNVNVPADLAGAELALSASRT
jgi:molybdopterin-guanine dinucleotide biosynthesis protein A